MADPMIAVFDRNRQIAENDDWSADPDAAVEIAAANAATGAGTLVVGSKDAALILTLAPGVYTAHVTGKAGSSGVGMVEIYEIPE